MGWEEIVFACTIIGIMLWALRKPLGHIFDWAMDKAEANKEND